MHGKISKILLVVAMIFVFSGSVFAAGYPVIDVSVLFETLLQKMQEAEHFVKQIEQWRNVLEHYRRQWEQIKRYYEELRGIAEAFGKDPSVQSMWKNTNRFLLKLSEATSATDAVTAEMADSLVRIKRIHSQIKADVDSMDEGTSSYDKAIYSIKTMYGGMLSYYEETLPENLRGARSSDARLRKVQEKIQVYKELLSICREKFQGIELKIGDAEASEGFLRSLVAPLRENRAAMDEMLAASRSALETWEGKSMELVQSGEMTSAQRDEALLISTSLRNSIDDLEKRRAEKDEMVRSYDESIVHIRETISRLNFLKKNTEDEISECEAALESLDGSN